jgi:hypothetical protein
MRLRLDAPPRARKRAIVLKRHSVRAIAGVVWSGGVGRLRRSAWWAWWSARFTLRLLNTGARAPRSHGARPPTAGKEESAGVHPSRAVGWPAAPDNAAAAASGLQVRADRLEQRDRLRLGRVLPGMVVRVRKGLPEGLAQVAVLPDERGEVAQVPVAPV